MIVTYNSEACLTECLTSCRRFGLFTTSDVLVVDNASRDGSVSRAREAGARVVENLENVGFAAAVNRGTALLDASYILLLNPDIQLQTGVESLLEDCRATGAAAAGGKLVGACGAVQRGFQVRRYPGVWSLVFETLGLNRLFPWNPVNRWYRCLDLDPDVACDVQQPAGAFLLFRKDCWEAAGGFDERFYPLWFEDVDFLKRISDGGKRIRYVPLAVAEHAGGHSLKGIDTNNRQLYWYGSLLTYLALHFSGAGRALVAAAVVMGVTLRSVMGTIRYRTLRPFEACGWIARLAASCVLDGKSFADQGIARSRVVREHSTEIEGERIRRSA